MPMLHGRAAAALLLASLSPATLSAEPILRLGRSLVVNSYTSGGHSQDVAMDADGDFVIAWLGPLRDIYCCSLLARRFDWSGRPASTELQVGSDTQSVHHGRIALDAAGDFVVTWTGHSAYQSELLARRWNSAGVGQGTEFLVNSYSQWNGYPEVVTNDEGSFVIVWNIFYEAGPYRATYRRVAARRFDSGGIALASEFQINSRTEWRVFGHAAAMSATGDFVVVWSGSGPSFEDGVLARRFSPESEALAAEFEVTTHTQSMLSPPAVAMDEDGDFVVAWGRFDKVSFTNNLLVRRFGSDGVARSTEFQVSTYTVYREPPNPPWHHPQPLPQPMYPDVAMNDKGEFVVAWSSSRDRASSPGIFAQPFDAAGAPRGEELQVNALTFGYAHNARVAIDEAGDFVVVWTDFGQGSWWDVFAQRFGTPGILDADANGTAGALNDGILILRFLFGFRGEALTGSVVDRAACNRCDGDSIAFYLSELGDVLDLDGDQEVTAFTDGVLALRFLFGFSGDQLVNGAVGAGCSRCDAAAIQAYAQPLL